MKHIHVAMLLIFIANAVQANDHPSLTEVTIGAPFQHPRANDFPDKNRPTTQFKVPNHGPSKELFTEYQVVVLNSSKKVVIASAEASFSTLDECQQHSDNMQNIMQRRFAGFKKVNGGDFGLTGVNDAYAKKEENSFYTLNCIRRYGPFWVLDLNIRGKEEDKELKAAWEEYFSNKR